MEEKIDKTIEEITLSVIQLNTDIENNNPSGLMKFIEMFIPLLNRFSSLMRYHGNIKTEHYSDFKEEISNLFDYLFLDGKISEIAKKLIDYNAETGINGTLIAIKHNGNPLKGIYKKSSGRDLFRDFILKYQSFYDNEPTVADTIIEKEYIGLIYKQFKEYINEPKSQWIQRFVYDGDPVSPIVIESIAKEGSFRLVLLGVLKAVQDATGNAFNYDKFVLDRFGLKGFEKAASIHKSKKGFKDSESKCKAILRK